MSGRVTEPVALLTVFTMTPLGFRTSIRKFATLFQVHVSVEVRKLRAELGVAVSQVQIEVIVPTTSSATS